MALPAIVAAEQPSADGKHLLHALKSLLADHLDDKQMALLDRAYRFAAKAHAGQRRQTGEFYICHPLAVALTVARLRMDFATIVAALLHDTLEDTAVCHADIVTHFGPVVAGLVDGVSKLEHLNLANASEARVANYRKMFLAMAEDLRVVLIKLADRLHNIRTVMVLAPEKRRRIARETLDIYAPIAYRLGIHTIYLDLLESGFQALHPMRFRVLKQAVKKNSGRHRETLRQAEVLINAQLQEAGIDARVSGREKHVYSIYRKMLDKQLSFAEVLDVFAVRIVVDSIEQCYQVLGILHGLFKPVPGRFKDYIAIAKINGYQSLHTSLFVPKGVPLEAQIRTADMEQMADSGIAAHWQYKSGMPDVHLQSAREWLGHLLDQGKDSSSEEYLEQLRVGLEDNEIYVFSPNGEIFSLPRDATPIDFAYAVHTDVGARCVGALVDNREVALTTSLEMGQTVCIRTGMQAAPDPLWLDFVMTSRARNAIRHYLRRQENRQACQLGQRLLDDALAARGINATLFDQQCRQRLLQELHYKELQDLLLDIGLGNRSAVLVAQQTRPDQHFESPAMRSRQPLVIIEGREDMSLALSHCCNPLPGDRIQGVWTVGRGIAVHRTNCRNLQKYRRHPDRWVHVKWAERLQDAFLTTVVVQLKDQRGALLPVVRMIEADADIDHLDMKERKGRHSEILFTLRLRDRVTLARIIRRLRNHPVVLSVKRG